MNFDEVVEFLKKSENGDEMATAVLDKLHKVNAEAKGLRDRAKTAENAVKAAKDGSEKFTTISEILEDNDFDLDGDIQEQFDTLLKKSKTADSSSADVKRLSRQIKKLEETAAATKIENDRLLKLGNRSKIKDALSQQFNEKILNSDVALNYRIDNGDFLLDDDGKVAYRAGDDLVTDGIIDLYVKNNPTEVRNTQIPGGNSKPGGGTPKGKISIDTLNNMTPQQYAALSDEQRSEIQSSISTGSE